MKDSSLAAKIKLIIPETITYIGAGAFNPRLSSVLFLLNGIPKNLEILRINSFIDCEFSKGKIIIPNKVKEIAGDALPLWWDYDHYKAIYNISWIIVKLFIDNICVNITGSPAEQANSTILTDTANKITPRIAKKKFFSCVNFLILSKILFLFLSSITSQPLSFLCLI